VKATRRATFAATGAAALGLGGCTGETPTNSRGATATGSTAATDAAAPDPDRFALDRAAAITVGLIAELAAATPVIDVGGRLAAIHAAHLAVLEEVAGGSLASSPDVVAGGPLTLRRLRRRELNAQRELARLARTAESGALSRVLASMSAGIAAGLSHRGEVPR
jgi:hypothetical protein